MSKEATTPSPGSRRVSRCRASPGAAASMAPLLQEVVAKMCIGAGPSTRTASTRAGATATPPGNIRRPLPPHS
ncbi:hypothetical protein CHLRE_02g095049v5 [Chlamydomonas reinhardtii]|uniref:Uncharacterized protein n=1 Tax=Chlamydomonas reinhardtii TaxID=3055 RepID=A0A2K3E1G5_CHLRE|nr:uncharacterized protein CHLRE_02g095049v5 [Chlamydomonas reinhardtii]PNW86660.1 hypothetical protein CHLRE_02g095049v5 [Chlamydomonas reinhardtii]